MFNSVHKGKKVLVTGHTGFKGSWLCAWLTGLGAEVYGYSKDIPTTPSLFETLNLKSKLTHITGDVRDTAKVLKTVSEIKPDFLFHMAAQPIVSISHKDPLETISSNAMGTANILEALRLADFKCAAVIITSDKCYENVEWTWGYRENDRLGGKDIYSGSKAAAEVIFHSYFHSFLAGKGNIRAATARAGNVIGGGDWAADRIVPDCMRAWSQRKEVVIRRPNATRPWQHVLEPLSGYLTLSQKLAEGAAPSGESFNFGPADNSDITVLELIKKLAEGWDFSGINADTGGGFHEAGLLKLCCDKAASKLRWRAALDTESLCRMTSDWYREFYSGKTDMAEMTKRQIDEYSETAAKKGLEWVK